jgi:type IV pilus assembly protein PilA
LRRSRGFTLIELLVVVAVISVLAAIATPALLRGRMTANETSAIGSLRAINSAQASYAVVAGRGSYATQLATLALPCPGSSASFISPDLSSDPSRKSGYDITLTAGTSAVAGFTDCNGFATQTAYYLTAVPVANGSTGHRAFATNGRTTIFFDPSGVAPTEAQMASGGTPIQ